VHFNGSILWGVIGPRRIFVDGLYWPLLLLFPVGLLLPIPFYFLQKRVPILHKINIPVMLGGVAWIPPATGLNFLSWAIVCWTFNKAVRERFHDWWSKYTMVLSAALDSGMAICLLLVFAITISTGLTPSWWGTEVFKRGCDWIGCGLLELQPGERMGS